MAYRCIKAQSKECDGCMECKPEEKYYCPICGEEVFESVYVMADGDVVGCENCIQNKYPEDVLDAETN